MRYYILLAIWVLSLTLMAKSASANDTWLDVNLASNHSIDYYMKNGQRHNFNEDNFGLGITKELSQSFDFKTGFFKNSFNNQSLYIGGNLKHTQKIGQWFIEPGVTLGVATGYQDTPGCNTYYIAQRVNWAWCDEG